MLLIDYVKQGVGISYIHSMKLSGSKLMVRVDRSKKDMRKVAAQEISNLNELQRVYANV